MASTSGRGLGLIAPNVRLVIGFGLILGLMIYLIVESLGYLDQVRMSTRTVVDSTMAKYRFVAQMRHASRERTVSLQRMVVLDDPFERDDEFMRFNEMGNQFAVARLALLESGLTDQERLVLERQGTVTAYAIGVQKRVIDLAMAGRTGEAMEVLNDLARPAQEVVYKTLNELFQLQQEAANQSVTLTESTYQQARSWFTLIAVVTLASGVLVAFVVIGRTTRTERDLFEAKEEAQVTLHSIGDAVITTNRHGNISFLNDAAERLTGWSFSEAIGRPLGAVLQLHIEGESEPSVALLRELLATDGAMNALRDLILSTRDGGKAAVELTAAPILDRHEKRIGLVITFRDVTEMRAMGRELLYQASHDHLTGLLNRRAFERQLGIALGSARRDGVAHAICYIDLDLFKVVNDNCGHAAGDELLRQLAGVLSRTLRNEDVMARLGGDEFGVLLSQCSLEEAGNIAESLRDQIRNYRFIWGEKVFEISASMGVAPIDESCGDMNDVMRAVDLACYSAKAEGRNTVYVARPGDQAVAEREGEIVWVQRLRKAMSEDRFVLFAQEIRPLHGPSRGLRCEVLLRTLDEQGELVGPAAFLPAAERYHLAPELDRWVLTHTLGLLAKLPPRATEGEVMVNINLSGQTLGDRRFLDFVIELLRGSPVPPEFLCFEITETAAISNLSTATRVMSTLRGMGCRFALDDFGSGLSSFAYLKNLPVDYLKIDGAFVRGIVNDEADHAMVESINQVAGALRIRTIAEYVENEEIWERVRRMGVDYGQGFGIARPEPLDVFVQRGYLDWRPTVLWEAR